MPQLGRIEFDDPTFTPILPDETESRIEQMLPIANALNRKVALVTGGTRGIGFGIARYLALEGFSLAINGRRPANDRSVELAISVLMSFGGIVSYHSANIGVDVERRDLVEQVKDFHGQLDVLINNAGVAPRERMDILKAEEFEFDRVVRTNLNGPHFLTQACASWMADQKLLYPNRKQSIIFITSVSATMASTYRAEYCVSKAALSMSAKLWAVRLAEYGIPVYEIRPGVIETDMTAPVKEKYDEMIRNGLTLHDRWGTPDDIGKVVAMLVRGDLPYATGSILTIDGGMGIQIL